MNWKRIVSLGMAAVLACSGLSQTAVYGQEISGRAGSIAENEEDFIGSISSAADIYILYGLKNPSPEITEVRIPETIQGKRVAVIGDGNNSRAFKDCPNLEKIVFPANLDCIEDGAFSECGKLEEIIFQGGKEIESNAFSSCNELKKVTLPENLEELGEGAFTGCGSLQEITVPGTVGRIERNVFAGCTALEKVVLGEGITSIEQSAFNSCAGLKEISLPDGLEVIETIAFSDCTALTEIEFPDTLKKLEGWVFPNTNLTEVILPQGIEAPDENPFVYCGKLSEFKMEGEGANCIVEDGVWFTKDKKELISYPGGKKGNYVVPDTVTDLALHAFWGCTGLENVSIPAGIERIEDDVFNMCEMIGDITVDEKNPVYLSKDGCLIDRSKHQMMVAPRVKKTIEVPRTVSVIGPYAVVGSTVKYLDVHEHVSRIDGYYGEYENFWMIVVKDSYGERYAIENQVPYIYKGDPLPDEPIITPDDATPTPTPPGPDEPSTPTPTPPKDENTENCSHVYKETEQRKADCRVGGAVLCVCQKCGHQYIKNTPALGHDYEERTEKQASFKRDGIVRDICMVCGKEGEKSSISGIEKVRLSATEFVWNGSVNRPSVLVRDRKGNELAEGTDYTVDFSGCKAGVGNYTVKINFQGDYTGTVSRSYKVYPKGTSLTKVTKKSKGFTLKWKKQEKEISGYEIQYSTSKNFTQKTTKSVLVKKPKTTSKTVSKLKGNKKYYIRIRTYKTVKVNNRSRKMYSDWSKTKTIKTKK